MSVDQITAEAENLSLEQRKVLIGRLLALGRAERDAEFRRLLAEKIDDQDPAYWVTMEDLSAHLRLNPDQE